MNKYTNINITDDDNFYQYLIEYPGESLLSLDQSYEYTTTYIPKSNETCINFVNDSSKVIKIGNMWIDEMSAEYSNTCIPNELYTKTLKLYFPHFAPEVYANNIKYALTINTWINGFRIVLGSFILNRIDAIASENVIKKHNSEYYEYVQITILDPWKILYDDSWKSFRSNICHESDSLNITEALLYFTLYPIEDGEEADYVMKDSYQGGQNSINISNSADDYLRLSIYPNISSGKQFCRPLKNSYIENLWGIKNADNPSSIKKNNAEEEKCNCIPLGSNKTYNIWWGEEVGYDKEPCDTCGCEDIPDFLIKSTVEDYLEGEGGDIGEILMSGTWIPSINCKIYYNNTYKDLQEYFEETYNINQDLYIEYNLVVRDNDNIYTTKLERTFSDHYTFYDTGINNPSQENLINWPWVEEYYKKSPDNSLYMQCIATLQFKEGDSYKDFIYIRSNILPLTQELLGYFINRDPNNITEEDDKNIYYVNLDNVDMNLYTINAVNKTINKIYQLDNPSDSKANIIQPIFFKARDVSNIIVHSAVTENICINLDSFKSKVKTFIIQIENTPFTEIGRTASGVIFKIIGNKLPGNSTSGVYYILNEDGELITNGNYRYEA